MVHETVIGYKKYKSARLGKKDNIFFYRKYVSKIYKSTYKCYRICMAHSYRSADTHM